MHLELAVRSVQRQVIAFQQLHFTGMVSGAEHVRHFNIELAEILCGHSIGQVKPDIYAPCGEAVFLGFDQDTVTEIQHQLHIVEAHLAAADLIGELLYQLFLNFFGCSKRCILQCLRHAGQALRHNDLRLGGLTLHAQPADDRCLAAGGGHRVVNGFLTVQLEHSLVEDIPAAAVQVQGRGLAQGVALGIGDHGGHRAVLAPPFVVGARQDVAACRQGQGVGQGLAHFIFAAVDAGRGLVSGGAVALCPGIRIDKAPVIIGGLALVKGFIQQLAAQGIFVQRIALGRAAADGCRITGHTVDEYHGIAGDNFADLDTDGQLLAQRVDGPFDGALDLGRTVGIGIQCVHIHIPIHRQGRGGAVRLFDLDRGGQAADAAAGDIAFQRRQLGQHLGDCTLGGRQAAADGIQRVHLECAGFQHNLDSVLAGGKVGQNVRLAAGVGGLGGGVFSLQHAVHIDIDHGGAVVAAHDGKAAAVHRKGERRTGGVGL